MKRRAIVVEISFRRATFASSLQRFAFFTPNRRLRKTEKRCVTFAHTNFLSICSLQGLAEFSYWIAENYPFTTAEKLKMLAEDSVDLRLRNQRDYMRRTSRVRLICVCGSPKTTLDALFQFNVNSMSATFSNPGKKILSVNDNKELCCRRPSPRTFHGAKPRRVSRRRKTGVCFLLVRRLQVKKWSTSREAKTKKTLFPGGLFCAAQIVARTSAGDSSRSACDRRNFSAASEAR